jgi:hypothetical protein
MMRKLIVTCECGQRMQVPRSAVGRKGMCPTCGTTLTITGDNAMPAPAAAAGRRFDLKQDWFRKQGRGRGNAPDDAKRRFGQAVDLYYSGRYGEALAIFNDLVRQFPGNPDIVQGRNQCMQALRRSSPLALEDQTQQVDLSQLNAENVKKVVLDKMLRGSTEMVQLQAAELAARLLGMIPEPGQEPATDDEPVSEEQPAVEESSDEEAEERGNGAHESSRREAYREAVKAVDEEAERPAAFRSRGLYDI